MTIIEHLKFLADQEKPGVLTMSPGPFRVTVDELDFAAARLLLPLFEVLPDEATVDDMLRILQNAQWWIIFMQNQPQKEVPDASN